MSTSICYLELAYFRISFGVEKPTKKQTSNTSRKQISRMNKVKGYIFHIEVATYVHGFRQLVVEYFNGKHSI